MKHTLKTFALVASSLVARAYVADAQPRPAARVADVGPRVKDAPSARWDRGFSLESGMGFDVCTSSCGPLTGALRVDLGFGYRFGYLGVRGSVSYGALVASGLGRPYDTYSSYGASNGGASTSVLDGQLAMAGFVPVGSRVDLRFELGVRGAAYDGMFLSGALFRTSGAGMLASAGLDLHLVESNGYALMLGLGWMQTFWLRGPMSEARNTSLDGSFTTTLRFGF